jgi:hypothetical protein
LCYAKITPAVLQRGDFDDRGRKDGEAVGRLPEFALNASTRVTADGAPKVVQTSWLA